MRNKIIHFITVTILAFAIFLILKNFDLFRENIPDLSRLTVMKDGREMPLSSAASDSLKFLYGKNKFQLSDGRLLNGVDFICQNILEPEIFLKEKFLKTDNRDLQNLLGVKGRYYSVDNFLNSQEKIYSVANESVHTPFSTACREAIDKVTTYFSKLHELAMYTKDTPPLRFLKRWEDSFNRAKIELDRVRSDNKNKLNESELEDANFLLNTIRSQCVLENGEKSSSIIKTIKCNGEWMTPSMWFYAKKKDDQSLSIIQNLAKSIDRYESRESRIQATRELTLLGGKNFKIAFEDYFNKANLFFFAIIFYSLSFAYYILSYAVKRGSYALSKDAFLFLVLGLAFHTIGIAGRAYIQMRPPVTNLFSTFVFVGCCSVFLALILYLKNKNKNYLLGGLPVGLLSLIIALNLPYSGDSMGMMRAVLNSNFWLTIHIVPMMLGYCGVLVAGFMASAVIVKNIFSSANNYQIKLSVDNIYWVLCFGLIFSFAGTMLGGVWAEMSWGRFWGWDPKENGALMVVLWTAGIIHAKRLGIFSDRLFLVFSSFGNIVIAWAWFGVNLMGIGLHSYGFINDGWKWFIIFIIIQLFLALSGLLLKEKSLDK